MSRLSLAFIGGVLAVGFFPDLPRVDLVAALMLLALLLYRFSGFKILCAAVIGIAWGTFYGYGLLANQLPEQWVGKDLLVSGRVVDLPVVDERRQRFVVAVDTARLDDESSQTIVHFPKKIQLSWYAKEPVVVRSGERWQWRVRLKRPRGFVNPGGFDYQVWLMRRGIGATGYVRESQVNQRLAPAGRWDIGAYRYGLREWLLSHSESPQRAVLLALLIGDRSMMEPEQWRAMQLTGVNHLVAISGLHVGFLAIVGLFVGSLIGRCINIFYHACPALLPGYLCAMSFAAIYSALAGFTIPTQRTLIMILVIQLVCLWRRSYRIGHVFVLALLAVVLNDPLAAYDMGFWLSFGAVAVLLFSFAGRHGARRSRFSWTWLKDLIRSQWVVFIGLFLPLSILLSSVSLIAPLANLVAIPLVTIAVVPALLLAAALQDVLPWLSQMLLVVADYGLRGLDVWLLGLIDLADHQMNPVINLRGWALVIAAVGMGLLLLPRGIDGRWLGYPAVLIALLLPDKEPPPLIVTVLDVGQGLAVVAETPKHRLVYDTGPAYSEKFEAGGAIVAPYLHQRGFAGIDKLIISHHDSDHSGGVAGVLKNLRVDEVIAGEPAKASLIVGASTPVHDCHAFNSWAWDEVTFYFLRTAASFRGPSGNTNNRSCVLVIEYAGHKILLPGDIEGRVERQLLADGSLPTDATLLLATHHGSRSSSTAGFVTHVRPHIVVYSAGYRSQHGHPHHSVVERFAAQGSRPLNTAASGALSFVWEGGALQQVTEQRHEQRRYWFD